MLTLNSHTAAVRSVAYSPDGTWLATGSEDQSLRMWDVSGHEIRTWSNLKSSVECVAVSSDSKRVLAGTSSGEVLAFDPNKRSSRATARRAAHVTGVIDIVTIPNSTSAISIGWDRRILFWDLKSHRAQALANETEMVPSAMSLAQPRHDSLAVSMMGGPQIWLMELDLRGLHGTLDYPGAPAFSTAFSPDGEWLAAGDAEGAIWLWRISEQGAPVALKQHSWTIYGLAFTPDSRRLVSGGADGQAIVWDVASRRPVQTFEWHKSWITGLAISPDGMTVATASQDSTVAVWDMPE